MISTENPQFISKEIESNNTTNLNNKININLNSIKEEKNYSNKDKQEHSSENENLGYNSNYIIKKSRKLFQIIKILKTILQKARFQQLYH